VHGPPATSPYQDRSDASLMRAAATDPAAFSEIYDRHAGTLYAGEAARGHGHGQTIGRPLRPLGNGGGDQERPQPPP